jgi:NAD(P)H-dependent FMN reductase
MAASFRVLLVSGSLRHKSTNTAALRTAGALAPQHVTAVLYQGLDELPHFNPDHDVDPLPPAVADLRRRIRAADALVFSTPEYAGALPGSLKNLLEWTIGDGEAGSIYQKPVAWINASPRGAADAHASLRTVLGYASATIVDSACVEVPVTGAMLDDAGLITDRVARDRIASVLPTLAAAVVRAGAGDYC